MFFCQKEILLLRIRQYVDLSIFHVRGLHVRSGIHSTTHIPTWTEHAIAEHIVMQTLTFSLYIQPLCFDLVKSNCAKLERPGAITRLHASMPFVYFVFMRKMHEKVFFKMRWQADSWREREREIGPTRCCKSPNSQLTLVFKYRIKLWYQTMRSYIKLGFFSFVVCNWQGK